MIGEADSEEPLRILDDYDFALPERSISQRPTDRRERARLMVLDRDSGSIIESNPEHRVEALPRWLDAGDLLVVNVTRVLPARLVGRKKSGGAAEALLLGLEPDPADDSNSFRALVKCGGRLRAGLEFEFGDRSDAPFSCVPATIRAIHERGEVTLCFEAGTDPYGVGQAPLPPYIKRESKRESKRGSPPSPDSETDLERYQTVYASSPGAVAAPTAGLHLTRPLLAELRAKGIEIAEVVLHVGAGTFRPLDREAFDRGRLHSERFVLSEKTALAIARARTRGGRVVAVGTTTTRVLESRADGEGGVKPGQGETDLFIRPGVASFQVVDAMLTNFHLPRSSLLMLVAAFMGRASLLAAYDTAIAEGFRFYSYGDAMLILRGAAAGAKRRGASYDVTDG